MTNSYTTTATWTQTHARYIAGKVAADLRGLAQEYGSPSEREIEDYLQELTTLMTGRYIKEISYGFERTGVWVVALKYTADMNGDLVADDRSGGIPRGKNITGAAFNSFLSYSAVWRSLSDEQRSKIKESLPIKRVSAPDPGGALVGWNADRSYSSAGSGLRRSTYGN